MIFVLDEDACSHAARTLLSSRGYEVYASTELIGEGEPDRGVAEAAAALATQRGRLAVIVTKNKGDYDRILNRRPTERPSRFRMVGSICITLKNETLLVERLEAAMRFIELEYEIASALKDKRIFVHITDSQVAIRR